MDDRKVLLNRVRICDFVLQEIALFLDNNPQNKEALECYQKYLDMQREAREMYVKRYGPLTHTDFAGGNRNLTRRRSICGLMIKSYSTQ